MKKEPWEEYLDKEEADYLRETGQSRMLVGEGMRYNQTLEDFKFWVKNLSVMAAFVLIVFVFPYFANRTNIYDAGKYEAEGAIEDYMVKKGDADSWGNDLVLKDRSMKKVDTEFYRENLGAKSTREVTFIYGFNNKDYKAVVLVERISDGVFIRDWRFYKVLSVK